MFLILILFHTLSVMTVNEGSLGFGLLVGQKEPFKNITLGFVKLWRYFIISFDISLTKQWIDKSWKQLDNEHNCYLYIPRNFPDVKVTSSIQPKTWRHFINCKELQRQNSQPHIWEAEIREYLEFLAENGLNELS